MQISKIKIGGYPVDVIFTGDQYIFNSIYGVVAVATRQRVADITKESDFVLDVGNHEYLGGSLSDSTALAGAKKFIRKAETSMLPNLKVTFTEGKKPLHKAALVCHVCFNY